MVDDKVHKLDPYLKDLESHLDTLDLLADRLTLLAVHSRRSFRALELAQKQEDQTREEG